MPGMTPTSIGVSTFAAATTDELSTGLLYAGALLIAATGFRILLDAITFDYPTDRRRAVRSAGAAATMAIVAIAPYILADHNLVADSAASAVSWLGGVLTTLASLVALHYATTPQGEPTEQATS